MCRSKNTAVVANEMRISAGHFTFYCDVTGSKFFSQLCMHVQLFSPRGGGGCSAVCTHPYDSSTFQFCLADIVFVLLCTICTIETTINVIFATSKGSVPSST